MKYLFIACLLACASAMPLETTFLVSDGTIAYSPSFANYLVPEPQAPLRIAEIAPQSAGISRITEYEATPLVPVAATAAASARYYGPVAPAFYY